MYCMGYICLHWGEGVHVGIYSSPHGVFGITYLGGVLLPVEPLVNKNITTFKRWKGLQLNQHIIHWAQGNRIHPQHIH